MASKLPLLLLLTAITGLSQFYRVSDSVIAPDLVRDLHLSAGELGWAGSSFFFALFALQLPVGLMFDRYGARRTVTVVSLFAVIGSLWIAGAADASGLIVGRTIAGVGCAASFMSMVFLCARWFEPHRLSTALSWAFAGSNLGILAGTTPFAWSAATFGWRASFVGLAVVTLLVVAVFYIVVRDRPPGSTLPTTHREPLRDVFHGLWLVWRTPGLLPLLSMHFFAYATMLTVLGIWGGPYLFDVYRLDGVERGNVLLAMGVAQTLGILTYGPMDRVLHSRKKVVTGGAIVSAIFLGALALLAHPPLWLAVGLLVAACYFCAFGTVIVAQGRTLFPDRLGGRAVTTVNLAQCLGLAVLPAVTGTIVEAYGANELAYRYVFATLAGGLLLGLIPYSRSPDNASIK
jgi:predicted MFS family arabinose efflux permease